MRNTNASTSETDSLAETMQTKDLWSWRRGPGFHPGTIESAYRW